VRTLKQALYDSARRWALEAAECRRTAGVVAEEEEGKGEVYLRWVARADVLSSCSDELSKILQDKRREEFGKRFREMCGERVSLEWMNPDGYGAVREVAEGIKVPRAIATPPMQPIMMDDRGVARFRENKYVRFLLDMGPFDLNKLSRLDFPDEDYEQLMQLIGYSVSGYGDLSTVSRSSVERADTEVERMSEVAKLVEEGVDGAELLDTVCDRFKLDLTEAKDLIRRARGTK